MEFLKGPRMVIAVDLTPIRPGGVNGGHKPAVFAMLAEAARQEGNALVFIYLTNSATHAEVRQWARPQDVLLCVLEVEKAPLKLENGPGAAEYLLVPPPQDLLRSIGADLLYAPFGALIYAEEGIPSMAFIADVLHRDYPQTLTAAQIAEREACLTQTVQQAGLLQCNSRSGVRRMMAEYHVPEEKLFHTYLPVQVRMDRARRGVAEPEHPVLSEIGAVPYFFYPANLWKHKNHETLLLAYRLYRHRAGQGAWDLVLTFHEDARAGEIRQLIAALGIKAHVHCPGYVSESDLRALWKKAGALVFPSLHEGFGIPLVEAMHYRVPILTSPDFSLSEIAGDAALFVDPRKPESIADGLLRMASNVGLRDVLRRRGERRLRFFDLATETRKLIAAWKRCAASRHGFPRRSLALESQSALTLPTPASDALWTFEVRASGKYPQNRYRCYLDDAAFGSFVSEAAPVYAFQCRPCGRVLRVIVDRRARQSRLPVEEGAIEAVLAHSPGGDCMALFERAEGGAA